MSNLKIFIAGSKWFGAEVFKQCLNENYNIIGVCTPQSDKHLRPLAELNDIPIINPKDLSPEHVKDADIGLCAHYFGIIGTDVREATRFGFIGYHPSLLPRHRGKSSIEWAIRMRDVTTGGTVYWLNSGIDEGDIVNQEFCFIPPELFAMSPNKAAAYLWKDSLAPIGLKLIQKALNDISNGVITRIPQAEIFSTSEPGLT